VLPQPIRIPVCRAQQFSAWILLFLRFSRAAAFPRPDLGRFGFRHASLARSSLLPCSAGCVLPGGALIPLSGPSPTLPFVSLFILAGLLGGRQGWPGSLDYAGLPGCVELPAAAEAPVRPRQGYNSHFCGSGSNLDDAVFAEQCFFAQLISFSAIHADEDGSAPCAKTWIIMHVGDISQPHSELIPELNGIFSSRASLREPLNIWIQDKRHQVMFSSPVGIPRFMALHWIEGTRTRDNEFVEARNRLAVAIAGGLSLIIPMIIMTLHESLATSLGTVCVTVLLFAFVLAA
jgi:hypothetical protein